MGWNRTEQKRGVMRFLTPVFRRTPPPSHSAEAVFGLTAIITYLVSMACILAPLTRQ
jgi:hypothetical protein